MLVKFLWIIYVNDSIWEVEYFFYYMIVLFVVNYEKECELLKIFIMGEIVV